MKRLAFVIVLCVAMFVGCTRPENAKSVLESAGYSSVELHGYGFFRCGQDDFFSDKFTAIGPSGKNVSGTVCSGILKGGTIRLN